MGVAENPKSYDQAFKALSDADPRGLLGIFGVLPLNVRAEVEALPRDLSMRPLTIDSGYLVRRAGRRRPYIVLLEAVTSWKRELAERLTWYGAFLGHKYELPVHVYVVPLTRESCPHRVPRAGRAKRGGVIVTTALNWVTPWTLDAQVVLDLHSAELDPWAVLFEATEAQQQETLARVSGHPKAAPLYRILGGMRYRKDRVRWRELLEGMNRMIRPELFRESLAVQEWLEEGRIEGQAVGQALGAATEARAMLLKFLTYRFPNWQPPASLGSITNPETLRALFDKAATVKQPAAMARAIDRAAKGLNF